MQADSHLDQGTRPAVYEKTMANVLAHGTDFHVDLGDTFMTDKYPNYRESLPQYIAQRYYLGLVGRAAPVFLVQGNHDGERIDRYDGTPNCMPVWSALTRRKYYPPVVPNGFYTGSTTEVRHAGRPENYYAFDWGDAQIIALDPFWTSPRSRKGSPDGNWTRTLGETQYQWLAKTLAASKAKYKFVFIHHLVGGLDDSARGGSEAAALYEWGGQGKDGKDEFKARRPGWEAPIHELLVRNKVAAVLCPAGPGWHRLHHGAPTRASGIRQASKRRGIRVHPRGVPAALGTLEGFRVSGKGGGGICEDLPARGGNSPEKKWRGREHAGDQEMTMSHGGRA
jgi:hypothetical protein